MTVFVVIALFTESGPMLNSGLFPLIYPARNELAFKIRMSWLPKYWTPFFTRRKRSTLHMYACPRPHRTTIWHACKLINKLQPVISNWYLVRLDTSDISVSWLGWIASPPTPTPSPVRAA